VTKTQSPQDNNKITEGNTNYNLTRTDGNVINRKSFQEVNRKWLNQFCEERTWAREVEEFPLLEAVTRKRLVKTQQTRKGLAGAVMIFQLWRFAVAL
jgi:hypothetical protein